MANATDLHVGKRLRRRRRLLGLTQQQLAESIGIRFQQIQKYECGANRVTASRLYELAVALNVPVNYFFEGLQQLATPATPGAPANDRDLIAADVLSQKETLELIRAYYKLGERPRRRLLDLAKALQDEIHRRGIKRRLGSQFAGNGENGLADWRARFAMLARGRDNA